MYDIPPISPDKRKEEEDDIITRVVPVRGGRIPNVPLNGRRSVLDSSLKSPVDGRSMISSSSSLRLSGEMGGISYIISCCFAAFPYGFDVRECTDEEDD
jgi:hypothetical protein